MNCLPNILGNCATAAKLYLYADFHRKKCCAQKNLRHDVETTTEIIKACPNVPVMISDKTSVSCTATIIYHIPPFDIIL